MIPVPVDEYKDSTRKPGHWVSRFPILKQPISFAPKFG